MNHRNLWTILGLGTLSIALIALPGSSKQSQDPSNPVQPHQDVLLENSAPETLHTRVRAMTAELQEGNPKVRVYSDSEDSSDDDVQFFMGAGGGWLGVGITEVSAEKAKSLKLPEEHGALLGRIVADSPAAKAGLKENDVVLEINSQRIEGTEQFRRTIHEIPAGRTANLTIWRDGRIQNVKVTLAKPDASNLKVLPGMPKSFAFRMPDLPVMPDLSGLDHLRTFAMVSPGHPLLGIDAESLEGDFGHFFGAPNGEGVLVRRVFANSPAAKAGVKVGDVITSMNNEQIRSASELREKLMTKHEEKTIKLGVLRNKAELTLSLELPQREEDEEHFLSERTNI